VSDLHRVTDTSRSETPAAERDTLLTQTGFQVVVRFRGRRIFGEIVHPQTAEASAVLRPWGTLSARVVLDVDELYSIAVAVGVAGYRATATAQRVAELAGEFR
jgi:hypothetical protein